MKTTKTNQNTLELIRTLKKQSSTEDVNIWKTVAKELERANRKQTEVNVGHIEKHSENDETILVPGKVLGDGKINHNVNVAAFKFTQEAAKKIEAAGGKYMSITDLMDENPKGSNVKLLK